MYLHIYINSNYFTYLDTNFDYRTNFENMLISICYSAITSFFVDINYTYVIRRGHLLKTSLCDIGARDDLHEERSRG